MDISLENWNTQNIIYTSNDVQEERRSGPWFWKGSVQQYRAISELGSEKVWMGEQVGGKRAYGTFREWGARKGEII